MRRQRQIIKTWFTLPQHILSYDHEMLPAWLGIGSAIILVTLIINGYMIKFSGNKREKPSGKTSGNMPGIVTLKVKGMTCNHCKQSVENAAISIEGVESATVDLANGKLAISGKDYDIQRIRYNIESAGYKIYQ